MINVKFNYLKIGHKIKMSVSDFIFCVFKPLTKLGIVLKYVFVIIIALKKLCHLKAEILFSVFCYKLCNFFFVYFCEKSYSLTFY